MRMNLFASSLLAATSTAMYISQDMALTNLDSSMSLAQTSTTEGWKINGTIDSKYVRPDDDCCIVFTGLNFTKPLDKPVCGTKKEGRDQYTHTN